MDDRQFDIVVFGATGVTAKYVFEELARASKKERIRYALAARNESKLNSVIEDSKKYLQSVGETIDDVSIIITDINDDKSLLEMCKKTKVVLNCVGPYNLLGEVVIKACIAAGTHYLDISGEPLFLEKMQLKYHDEAMQKGIYIIGACGFDSLPCDLGVSLVKNKFKGDLNSVEAYLQYHSGPEGRPVNTGTWNSIVDSMSNLNKTKNIRRQLNQKIFKKPVKFSHPMKKRSLLFKSEVTRKWCVPFPGSDKTVTIRSQLYNYNYKNERPAQIKTYFMTPLLQGFFLAILGVIMFAFSHFKLGRSLLASYPGLFSFGMFKGGGSTREQMKAASVTIVFWAEGWPDKLDIHEQHIDPPNKHMKVVLNAPDAACLTTSLCVVTAGIVCLKERGKMPGNGGVLTPGAAFQDTTLLEQLQKSGLNYTIMEK